jgi:Caspase domain
MRGTISKVVWLAGLVALGYLTEIVGVRAQALDITSDAATGVRLGIPRDLVGPPSITRWGQNWAGKQISIDTLSFGTEGTLAEHLEKFENKKNRTFTRHEIETNRFVLEGRDSGRNGEDYLFHVEMQTNNGEYRGLSIVYTASTRRQIEPVVQSVVSSFEPFPKRVIAATTQPPESPEKKAAERKIQELTDTIAERDRRLTDLGAKLARLEGETQASQRERDLRAERDQLLKEQDGLRKQRDDLRKERDELANAQGDLRRQISELKKRLEELPQAGETSTARLALVIGNDRYKNLPANQQLARAVNDATAVGNALVDIGFKVTQRENLEQRDLLFALDEFAQKIKPGDIALVFFAGHGVAIAGANYILPTDVQPIGANEEGRLRIMSVAEETIISQLQSKARVVVLILDACRDNPFRQGPQRSFTGAERGLTRVPERDGVLSIYSAGFGQTALESLGPNDRNCNSVFTRVLVGALYRTRETHLAEIMYDVSEEVEKEAATIGHQQKPATYNQAGRLFLASGTSPHAPPRGNAMGGGDDSCAGRRAVLSP